MLPSYQASFSVSLTCNKCIQDVSNALERLPGIKDISFSLPSKLVTTTGNESPSRIIAAIQATGRTAILRGSGDANCAAVCILETPPAAHLSKETEPSQVRGLVRFVELSYHLTMLDMTLTGLRPGTYHASIRKNGDLSCVPKSMGGVFTGLEADRNGDLGQVIVDNSGRGCMEFDLDWRVWEMVGRGIMVERIHERHDEGIVAGVVARSAGVWENEKTVCGCSGKTIWEEREEMVGQGML